MTATRILPDTELWPSQLADLAEDTPQQLWSLGVGNLRLLALRSVAIVGCRAASAYGRAVASDIAAGLAAHGWAVVSGAAFGIDAAAHRGALSVGGCTIAVLPGGVDVPVPQAHAGLLSDIQSQGLLVSEMDFGVTPRRHMFLIRNRLIAALSRAVVIVEADNRSGALNTVRRAETLGRLVLATPGPVTSATSRGTHEWIRSRRAELVSSADDVLDLIEPFGDRDPARQSHDGLPTDVSTESNSSRTETTTQDALALLVERALGRDPMTLTDLAAECGLASSETLRILGILRSGHGAELTVDGWRLPLR